MSGEVSVTDSVPNGAAGKAAESNWFGWGDWAGMVASIGCAIHCAAMPFVVAYLPALGLSFLADAAFHQWMAVGCFAIALTAFAPGLRKHGQWTPVIVGSVGLVMISIAAFGFSGECCSACESNTASVALANSAPAGKSVSTVPDDSCSDACCPDCTSDGSAILPDDASMGRLGGAAVPTRYPALAQLRILVAPWLTPLGGIVLVAAHLLNRRYGCLCGCCENESVTRIA